MDERRRLQRLRALKAGTISFNRAGGINCRVRNMSPAGACLEVASQVGIPDNFVLVVSYDKITSDLPCDLALGYAHGRGVSRCLNAPHGCGCDGMVIPPARRIRGWQICRCPTL